MNEIDCFPGDLPRRNDNESKRREEERKTFTFTGHSLVVVAGEFVKVHKFSRITISIMLLVFLIVFKLLIENHWRNHRYFKYNKIKSKV